MEDFNVHLRAFLVALDDLDQALEDNVERARVMQTRIEQLKRAVDEGRSLTDVVPDEETPLIVQLLTDSADTLHAFGSRVRRTEAKALHDQGMTMDRIAALFGVTRQRVSALLREPENTPQP